MENFISEEKKKRRNWQIALAIIFVLSVTMTGIILLRQDYQKRLQTITIYQSRLTFSEDKGDNLKVITRQNGSEIFYRVTLENPPLGRRLSLNCQWFDPQGNMAHKNVYQTRKIDKEVWTTYCRHAIGNAAFPGTWKVEMYLGDRLLSRSNFQVE